jgi:NAD(P)H-dependent FMN reductase
MQRMKLLVFAGSTRQQSYNRKLARVTAEMARTRGAEVTHLELGDFDVPMYNADLEAEGTPADVMRLKQIFFEHPATGAGGMLDRVDALCFAAPVFFHSVHWYFNL